MHRPPPVPQFVVSPRQDQRSLISPPIDLRQTLVQSFLAARELQPNSVRSYQQDLQQLMDWCDASGTRERARRWNRVRQRQVIGFKSYLLNERQLSKNTVRRVLQTLKSFYRWMSVSGHVTSDPTTGVQLPEAEEAESQELSDIEVEQIYQAVQQSKFPERDRAIVTALLHGLRGQEVSNLNVGDYQTQIIDLHSHRGRHTYATNLLIKYGLGEGEAMKLTRHRD